jgi:hypothetical protein
MKRKRNIIAFGPGLDPKLDVVICRGREGRTRNGSAQLSSELRDSGNLRQCKRLTQARSGLALECLELRVSGNQSTGTVQATEDRSWLEWNASHDPDPIGRGLPGRLA